MNYHKKFEKFGYLSNFKAINASSASKIFLNFQKNLNKNNQKLIRNEIIYNPHLVFSSFYNLIENKKILKIVKTILGEKIVLWNSLIFYKKKKNFVSFHQDLKYWKFKNSNCLTVSLALTDSNLNNGCLHVVPKSHKNVFNHEKKFRDKYNLLGGNQFVNLKPNKAIPIILSPGQFSIHHGNIVHGSFPNNLEKPRALYAMRFAKYNNPSKIYFYANYMYRRKNEKKYFEELPSCKNDYDKNCLIYREKLLQNSFRLQIRLKIKKVYWLFKPYEFLFLNKFFRKFFYQFLKII